MAHPLRRLMLPSAAALTLLATSPASAQRRVMVMDDGNGPQVMHMSMPDLASVREPDYLRRDLPTFRDELTLSETQQTVVRLLLDGYLSAFKTLIDETLPESQMAGGPMVFRTGGPGGGPGGPGGEGPMLDGMLKQAMEAAGTEDGNIDVEFTPGSMTVAIRAGAGGEMPEMIGGDGDMVVGAVVVPGGQEGGPVGDVMIAIGGDEADLPEGMLEELQKKADEMAAQIRKYLEENEGGNLDGLAGAMGPDPERMAKQQKYFEELAESAKKVAKAKKDLAEQFEMDVKSQLALEQLEAWPGLERTLTRQKTLPKGRLDGESIDLLELFEVVNPTEEQRESVRDFLDAYELQLHEALVRRNEYLEDAGERIDKAMKERKPSKALPIVDRSTDLRVAVRQVNRNFAETIAAGLDEEAASGFKETVLKNAFPRVYRTTDGARAFAAARKLDGLDEGMLAMIDDLERTYQIELERINEKIREAILKNQPEESRRTFERLKEMMAGEGGSMGGMALGHDEEDPVHQAFAKRKELDERSMKRLYALFSEEQVAMLPKLPSEKKASRMIWAPGANDN